MLRSNKVDINKLKRVCIISISILLIGLAYAFIVIPTGIVIPCKFRLITGLYCPGCGITRACLDILNGNIYGAIRHNIGLFLVSPILGFIVISDTVRYITNQERKQHRFLIAITIIIVAIWFVVRNLMGI